MAQTLDVPHDTRDRRGRQYELSHEFAQRLFGKTIVTEINQMFKKSMSEISLPFS